MEANPAAALDYKAEVKDICKGSYERLFPKAVERLERDWERIDIVKRLIRGRVLDMTTASGPRLNQWRVSIHAT